MNDLTLDLVNGRFRSTPNLVNQFNMNPFVLGGVLGLELIRPFKPNLILEVLKFLKLG